MNDYPGFLSSAWFSAQNAGNLRNRLRMLILEQFLKQVRLDSKTTSMGEVRYVYPMIVVGPLVPADKSTPSAPGTCSWPLFDQDTCLLQSCNCLIVHWWPPKEVQLQIYAYSACMLSDAATAAGTVA